MNVMMAEKRIFPLNKGTEMYNLSFSDCVRQWESADSQIHDMVCQKQLKQTLEGPSSGRSQKVPT